MVLLSPNTDNPPPYYQPATSSQLMQSSTPSYQTAQFAPVSGYAPVTPQYQQQQYQEYPQYQQQQQHQPSFAPPVNAPMNVAQSYPINVEQQPNGQLYGQQAYMHSSPQYIAPQSPPLMMVAVPTYTVPELCSASLRQHLMIPLTNNGHLQQSQPEYAQASKTELLTEPENQYRDKFFAFLFLVHFVAFHVAGLYLFHQQSQHYSFIKITQDTIYTVFFTIAISLAIAVSALVLTKYHTRLLIVASIWFGFFFQVAILCFCVYYQLWVSVIISGLLLLLQILWMLCIRRRLPFAVAMLKLASDIVTLWPGTLSIAFGSILVQIGIYLMCFFSGIGLFTVANSRNDPMNTITTAGYLALFGIVLSVYWTTQVIKGIVHCTVSGVAAYFWFLYPTAAATINPTVNSFKRATTTSFGSICLGCLLIAIIRTLRVFANMFSSMGNSGSSSITAIIVRAVLFCIARILLYILDVIVTYINQYAFAQVAIYGKSYFTAAKDTWGLLKTRGCDAIMNDSLIGSLLGFTAFAAGLIGGLSVGLFTYYIMGIKGWYIWGICCGIFSACVTLVAMETLDSAVITIFVCLAEDPSVCFQTKPAVYQNLVNAMSIGYPHVKSNNKKDAKKAKANRKKNAKSRGSKNTATQPLAQPLNPQSQQSDQV